jgi:hypothetical protein
MLWDDLEKFGFKQFTDGFVQKLKNELLPQLKDLVDRDYNRNNVKGAGSRL